MNVEKSTIDSIQMNLPNLFLLKLTECFGNGKMFMIFFSLFPAVKMFRILFGVSYAFYAYKLNWIQFPLREEIVCAISVLSAPSSFRRSFSGTWRKNMRTVRTFAAAAPHSHLYSETFLVTGALKPPSSWPP